MDRTVIEFIPIAPVFGVSRVVTSSQPTVVIAHCIQVIEGLLAIGDGENPVILGRNDVLFDFGVVRIVADWLGIDDVVGHVESSRKMDFGLVLFFSKETLLLESLEVEDQDFGSSVNAHLFIGLFVFLAVGTKPLISCLQLLRLTHRLETLRDVDRSFVVLFAHFVLLADIIEILQFIKRKVFRMTLREPDVELTVLFVNFIEKISKDVFVTNLNFLLEFVLKTSVETIELFPIAKEQLEGPTAEHHTFVFFKRLPSEHFFVLIVIVGFIE